MGCAKKILILGGLPQHCDAVIEAKSMGLYVIVVDFIENSPAKQIADKSYLCSIDDVDTIIRICKKERVDGVLNLCVDPAQMPYAKICEKLNLPCFGTIENFRILTDKKNFKDFCKIHGVDTIQEYSIDMENFEDTLKSIEYPVMVKPVDGRGSRGQTECYCIDDVKKAIPFAKENSKTGCFIIEKLMINADDFTVIYMVKNKKAHPILIYDRILGALEDNLNKLALYDVAPSKHIDLYYEKVNAKVCKMIEALGIENGPLFFQGFWDGETVRFYDPALRLPGGQGYRIIKEVYGVNLLKMLIHFSITGSLCEEYGSINYDCKLNGKVGIIFMPILNPGKITEISGIDNVKQLPSVIGFTQLYFKDDSIKDVGITKQRFAFIHIVCNTKSKAVNVMKEILSILSILDENGKEMIFSNYSIEKLLEHER